MRQRILRESGVPSELLHVELKRRLKKPSRKQCSPPSTKKHKKVPAHKDPCFDDCIIISEGNSGSQQKTEALTCQTASVYCPPLDEPITVESPELSPVATKKTIYPIIESAESIAEKEPQKSDAVKCKYLTLRDRENHKSERFKLFYEKELPSFQHRIYQVELNDLQCDNDCQTENEQIESAMNVLQRELVESVKQCQENFDKVSNIKKYEEDRIKALKKPKTAL